MKENFLYIEEKDIFIDLLESEEITINDDIIVFIEETKEVWTHGSYFDGSSIDLSDYYKKGEIDSILNVIRQQIANVDVTEQLKDYALKSELPVNVSELNNDEGYLTQHQDISHLATKEELDAKDFYEIHNNPIVNDGDGKLVFVDESGNIGLQLEADNTLYVKDVVAGDDVLSNKMDITDNLVRVEDTDDELDEVPEDVCVKYVSQSLTEEQKNQVRENLGIPSMEYVMSLYQELLKLVQNNNGGSTTIPLATLDTAVLDNSILS